MEEKTTASPTSSSATTCEVCIEKFNKTSHQKIVCVFCSYEACRKCCEYYILSSIREAECMNCKKEWTRDFLFCNFTMRFINQDYKCHREKVLFEKEKAILPRTQAIVERMKLEENLHKQIAEMETQLNYLRREHAFIRNFNPRNLEMGDGGEVEYYYGGGGVFRKGGSGSENLFAKKCPNETCKGFLNPSSWRCGLCETVCCKECHETILDSDLTTKFGGISAHECKPENVASAKLISKDSKPCPKCGVLIFKSEGCSQMWCTQCHVAFDWRTGQIETKTIHNPHYYEYLRRISPTGEIPRNPLDVVGGGGGGGDTGCAAGAAAAAEAQGPQIIDNHFVRTMMFFSKHHKGFRKEYFLGNKLSLRKDDKEKEEKKIARNEYIAMCRHIIHIRDVELYRLQTGMAHQTTYEDYNRDLRIRYLSNRISEESFKTEIQKREKSILKKRDLINIFETVVQAFTDISFRFKNDSENEDSYAYLKEFEALVDYTNECFESLSKNYNSKCYKIDYLFELSKRKKK